VSNNRSVMPLDVLGRTRATLKESACFTLPVRKDRVTAEPPSWLGLGTAMIPMNQESEHFELCFEALKREVICFFVLI
jgi:hypothetical protein